MRRASDTAGRPRGWLRAAGPALTLALSLALAPAPVRAQLLEEPAAAAEDHKIEPAPLPAAPVERTDMLRDPAIRTQELRLRLIPLTAEELERLASDWLAIVRARTAEVIEQQIAIDDTQADAVEEAARDRLTRITEERRTLFDKYSAVIDNWELKGGDPAKIKGYRDYRGAILVEETRDTD